MAFNNIDYENLSKYKYLCNFQYDANIDSLKINNHKKIIIYSNRDVIYYKPQGCQLLYPLYINDSNNKIFTDLNKLLDIYVQDYNKFRVFNCYHYYYLCNKNGLKILKETNLQKEIEKIKKEYKGE